MVNALSIDGNAASATKLQTPREVKVNLGSTITEEFDGTRSIIPGVFGILPIQQGGTGTDNLEKFAHEIKPYLGTAWAGWGNEDEIGDTSWCANLQNWTRNLSTPLDRLACVGKKKKMTLITEFLNLPANTPFSVVCIGADQDGDNTLTFQTEGAFNKSVLFDDNSPKYAMDSKVYRLCIDTLLNIFPNRTYCKSVKKLVSTYQNDRQDNPADQSTDSIFWIPSVQEMGLSGESPSRLECTEGTNNLGYSYYTDNLSRKKRGMRNDGSLSDNFGVYWLRSRYYKTQKPDGVCMINIYGSASSPNYNTYGGFAPCFVIG